MKRWNRVLGVECSACHRDVKRAHLDDTPGKEITRKMVRLTAALEAKRLPGAPKLTCWTCHRGSAKVPTDPP